MDDFHLNICIWDRVHANGLNMDYLLDEADKTVNRVARGNHLPLEECKHEKLV